MAPNKTSQATLKICYFRIARCFPTNSLRKHCLKHFLGLITVLKTVCEKCRKARITQLSGEVWDGREPFSFPEPPVPPRQEALGTRTEENVFLASLPSPSLHFVWRILEWPTLNIYCVFTLYLTCNKTISFYMKNDISILLIELQSNSVNVHTGGALCGDSAKTFVASLVSPCVAGTTGHNNPAS